MELTRCLKMLAVGDTLIIWKLDRLSLLAAGLLIGTLDDLKARAWPSSRSTKRLTPPRPRPRDVINGGDTGKTGTLLDPGAHEGGVFGSGCPWGKNGL